MKIIRLLREWASYKANDIVVASNNHADWVINQNKAELIAVCPSFNNRLGGKGRHKMLPLTTERIEIIIENLEADIGRAKRMRKILVNLRGEDEKEASK